MKNISDFKKKFKVANLEFKQVTDQDGNVSKWLKAVAKDIIVICDPKQKVTLTSPIKEIKPGTWMVTKVYTSTVVFTV
jgi:hypothetical protein